MEFGPVLSEDEALIKKAVRPEEYDKIKELIALAGEDDLGAKLFSKQKCWKGI
jgi:DNA polymerase-3 subunit alpha